MKRALPPACQIIPGTGVDHAVGELLLETLTALARRRYLAVDPDNRLVDDTLDWNDTLRQLADARDEHDRARANGNERPTAQQRKNVIALAKLPAPVVRPPPPHSESARAWSAC